MVLLIGVLGINHMLPLDLCKRHWLLSLIRGVSQQIVDFCYSTKLFKTNSMVFKGCVYICMGNILY